jgi:isocitrate lyase
MYKIKSIISKHIVPIIADIDAGFGNEEATYLLTKKMIEAGACAFKLKIKFRMLNNVVIKMESYCTS